MYARVGIEY